ncbi:MAG: hypothetical protein K2J82_02325 [Muribaculaceae bacterium]|nr:hypothetical protein [Muribaculaceae bacterium]MDE6753427.1 hypothetical protein [Muribaculaceae bacterium]
MEEEKNKKIEITGSSICRITGIICLVCGIYWLVRGFVTKEFNLIMLLTSIGAALILLKYGERKSI